MAALVSPFELQVHNNTHWVRSKTLWYPRRKQQDLGNYEKQLGIWRLIKWSENRMSGMALYCAKTAAWIVQTDCRILACYRRLYQDDLSYITWMLFFRTFITKKRWQQKTTSPSTSKDHCVQKCNICMHLWALVIRCNQREPHKEVVSVLSTYRLASNYVSIDFA